MTSTRRCDECAFYRWFSNTRGQCGWMWRCRRDETPARSLINMESRFPLPVVDGDSSYAKDCAQYEEHLS